MFSAQTLVRVGYIEIVVQTQSLWVGSGCGRVVASDTGEIGFEFSHLQLLLNKYMFIVHRGQDENR